MRRRLLLIGVVTAVAAALPVGTEARPPTDETAFAHLGAILKRSKAPEYRRFGSAGMARVSDYIASELSSSGYKVMRHEFESSRYAVDYSKSHKPELVRLDDRRTFKVDSVFETMAPTGPEGLQCTVRAIEEVEPGDCGFVPFGTASPEWNNALQYAPGEALDAIAERGGVGAVIQGDVENNAVFALRLRKPLPAVVAVVQPEDVVGNQVRLRAMGATVPATVRNVVGVLRPPEGASDYLMLLAHADGWYQAAADNGSGAAAVLRAAQLLARDSLRSGVIIAEVDGEETGLLGSQRLAQDLTGPGLAVPDGGPPVRMADIKAVVNLDASSAVPADVDAEVHSATGAHIPLFSWRAMVYSEEPVLPALFLSTFAAQGVLGAPVSSMAAEGAIGGWRTDAKWFHEAGVPVVWPVAGYPAYHTDKDTLAAVDPGDLEAVARASAALVRVAADAPVGRVVSP